MKKILVLLAIAFLATSCKFKSKEVSIEGTDLVTFTVENSDKLGVKEPGETGKVIFYAEFYSVECYAGFLWTKKEKDADFDIYNKAGKNVHSSIKIFEEGNNYRIIEVKNHKCYISDETKKIGTPYKELFVAQYQGENYIFCKSQNWSVGTNENYPISSTVYDKIIILYSGGQVQALAHLAKSYNNKTWHVWHKQGNKFSSGTKSYTDSEISNLTSRAEIKWSKADGNIAIYEK